MRAYQDDGGHDACSEQKGQSMRVLAIVGTAGRGSDASRLTLPVWNDMKRTVYRFVKERGYTDVISGGSAYSDHLAVGLFNAGIVTSLILALPCEFDWHASQFIGNREGRRLNDLHRWFGEVIGKSPLEEIKTALYRGAEVIVDNGFHARNSIVANRADAVIAFTFGHGPVLDDGGTADTARKYLKTGKRALWHVDLNDMSLHENGTVQS
jgi:hypothetical protein